MAINFPSSPTNGQTHVVGSVTYTYDGTKWTAVAAGGGGGGSSQWTTSGSDIYYSTGKVGVGTTTPGSLLEIKSANANPSLFRLYNAINSATSWGVDFYRDAGAGTNVRCAEVKAVRAGNEATDLKFSTANLGGTLSERARIDYDGRLLVGTSTSNPGTNSRFQVADTTGNVTTTSYSANNSGSGYSYFLRNRGASVDSHAIVQSGDSIANLYFSASNGSAYRGAASIEALIDGTPGSASMPGRLSFSTTASGASSPTERMRIGSDGNVSLFNGTSTFLRLNSSLSPGVSNRLIYGGHSAASIASATECFRVNTNGDVQNTNNSYTGISDIKLKENIVDANSQWNDLKALQVRNYNFKKETGQQTHTQIGLIAQEVELVSPGLVYKTPDQDDDGNDLGTVTKGVNYSVLYMKAVKALQEAMARIETLEAKVAALEGPAPSKHTDPGVK